ncbi:hypothetical protein [Candidatus Tisiphia endosymbiont of Ceraclea dissimilis]
MLNNLDIGSPVISSIFARITNAAIPFIPNHYLFNNIDAIVCYLR